MTSAPARRIPVSDLEHGAPLVEPAQLCGGLHHGVLAAHVVGDERQLGPLAHRADHVEVGERRLDHDHVGAFGLVDRRLEHRLAHVGGIHLILAPVAERRARSPPPRGTDRRRRSRT